jgi:hypothetical protein
MLDVQLMKREEKRRQMIERNNLFWNKEMIDITFEVSKVPKYVKKIQ